MAFTVAPTSGTGPFLFDASFENENSIKTAYYRLSFLSGVAAGTCPPPFTTGVSNDLAAQSLLETGSYVQPSASIAPGSCRTYTLLIRRLSDNEIVSTMSVNVSNI